MIATVLLSGAFLWVSAGIGSLLLFARPIWRVLTEEPRADVLGEVESGPYRSTVRGMSR